MKKTTSVLLLASFFIHSISMAEEKCMFPVVRKLDRGSEISTFVYDFWDYSKKNFPKDFKKYPFVLQADGPSAGDYHFGNVGIFWNETKTKNLVEDSETEESDASEQDSGATDIAIIDMDDSGFGNQFADLIKMLLFVKSVLKKDGLEKLALKFYLKGLENKDGSLMPDFQKGDDEDDHLKKALGDVKKLLRKPKHKFDESNQDYVTKKMDGKRFSKDWGLQSMSQLESDRAEDEARGRPAVEELGTILDSGFQINVSGSSIGAYRFVYLVESHDQDGKYMIVELKQNNCAGVVTYDPKQLPPAKRFASNKVNLQSSEYWKQSKVINMGERTYLLRVKQENLLGKLVEKINKKDVEAYTAFFAYTLGRIQAPKANQSFVAGLSKNVKEKDFINTVADFVKAYDQSLSSRTKKQ